jgi:hypothetical protein
VGEVPSFYGHCIDSVKRYCERHGFTHKLLTEPKLRIAPVKSHRSQNALRLSYLPILEKYNALEFLDRYDQVCILDADVFIRGTAGSIFEDSRSCFSGVFERAMPLLPHYREKVRKYSEGQYRGLTDVDWQWSDDGAAFYNCGVMVLDQSILKYLDGQTPAQFLRRPEFERFINGEGHWRWSTDQTLWNYHVKKSGMSVTNLDWRWNALYGAVRDIEQAYFVHFFLSSKMPRGGAEIPEIISRLQ